MSSIVSHHRTDAQIDRVFATFEGLLGIAETFLAKQRYRQAAVSAEIAALYASYNHPGQFASPRLERLLRIIGHRTVDDSAMACGRGTPDGTIRRVLHVLTAAKDVGGDSRFVWRWIQRDVERCHSVALTSQLDFDVPAPLVEAVAERHGRVHVLDRERTPSVQRAQALRRIARDADVVFLHVYPEDVVPTIAFADKTELPPIVFVVQADHQFWVGVSVADLFVHLRESGERLSETRRGVDRSKIVRLPIPLDAKVAQASKAAAKKAVGLSEDTVVMLSIARSVKYEPIESARHFAEVLTPILNKYRNAVLFVVGPSNENQWKAAGQRTDGRIRVLGERSDTAGLYEAADIYLDSFPFSSNTSLLEAGSFGVPLVTYFPYSAEAAVLGAGSPGLDANLIRADNLEDYRANVSRLIEESSFRAKVGQLTGSDITLRHVGNNWNKALESMYLTVVCSVPKAETNDTADESRAEELDLLLNRYYSRHVPLEWVIGWYARDLPYRLRRQLLFEMLRFSRSFAFSMFLPDWIRKSVGGRLRGWRRLPVVAHWLAARG